jgi:RNA recognition motif-containing protein
MRAPPIAVLVADATEESVMGRKLYVGNFPYETGETELQELFARSGTVETVKVMRDMATGRARGFAFVEMSTDDEAQKAITELNDYQLGGRGLTVNEARPKPAGGGGFGGGGFGGGDSRRRSEPRW